MIMKTESDYIDKNNSITAFSYRNDFYNGY